MRKYKYRGTRSESGYYIRKRKEKELKKREFVAMFNRSKYGC